MLFGYGILSYANSTIYWQCAPQITVGPYLNTSPIGDWLSEVSYAARFWRGSIKYTIHFCLPAFYSFRVQIQSTSQIGGTVDPGDLCSKILDIKGDTWVDILVPYEYSTPWRDTYYESSRKEVPTISINLLTPVVGSSAPSSPVIYVNVWRAGAEDTQFSMLRGVRPGSTIRERLHKQNFKSNVDIMSHFSKPFPGLVEGTMQTQELGDTACEIIRTVSDCFKRTSSTILSNINSLYTFPGVFNHGTSGVNNPIIGGEPFYYFGSMFRYWRGGRILGHTQSCNLVSMVNDGTHVTYGDGVAHFFTSTTNAYYSQEKIHIHWASELPYMPNLYSPGQGTSFDLYTFEDETYDSYPVDVTGIPNTVGSMNISGADDFMMMYPIPFFPRAFLYPIPFKQPVTTDVALPSLSSSTILPANSPPHLNWPTKKV